MSAAATSTKRRIRVIVNPSARGGAGARALAPLRRQQPPPGIAVEWHESRSAAHLRDLVAAAARDAGALGAPDAPDAPDALDLLAVAGGDGTVALAVAALGEAGARVPLGILPTGSGNDFARDVGVPRNPRAAFRLLCTGAAQPVDVLETSGGGRVVAVASVGFDALALPIVHGGLPRSKALNIYAAVQGLLHYVPRPVRVTWAGGSHDGPLVFAAAANTTAYAGGFRITPAARLDDGLLDICLVRATGPARLMQIFAQVVAGGHERFPEVIVAQSPWVRIEARDGALPVAVDGDLTARTTPIELACRRGALTVMCPVKAQVALARA